MMWRWTKRGIIITGVVVLAGGLLLGGDLVSYARSSAKSVRSAVKDSIPTEFELQRARDLVEDIIPEMQANIRLIAQEEVEIASLKSDIADSDQRLADERGKIEKLSAMMAVRQANYEVGGHDFTRVEIKEDLARRFGRFKEAEVIFAGKSRLLKAREKSLRGAIVALQRIRQQKILLEDRIASLAAQHRLVQAASVGSRLQVDDTKLARADKLIGQIQKRLDVAERVLAHEARFTEPIPMDTITDVDLLAQIQDHLAGKADTVALVRQADRQVDGIADDRQ